MRPTQPPPGSARRAGVRPVLLLLVGAAALALAALLLMLGPGHERAALDPRAPGEVAAGGGGAALDLENIAEPAAHDEPARSDARGAFGVGVRLSGPGRLSGRVVERATGAGVAGARVELLGLPPAGTVFFDRVLRLARLGEGLDRRAAPIAVAATDARGEFDFVGVREGSYYLDAVCAAHVPEAPQRVEVLASGAGGPAELWVRPGGGVVGRMSRYDGSPVAGADVLLLPGPGLVLNLARGGSLRALEARTDPDGAFAFLGVTPGEGYELSAQGPGTTVSHAVGIAVRAGEQTRVELAARAGGSVAGRVLSLELDAEDDAGEPAPLAGAHVAAVPRGLRDLRFAEELLAATHALTAEDGAYVLQRVPPGEVDLVVFAPGHLMGVVGPVVVLDELRAEAPDAELERGPTVRGRVVDGAGNPLAGVRLRWNTFDFRELDRNGLEIRFAPFLTQAIAGFEYPITGVDGAFEAGPFPGEPPHRIQFFAPGFQDARASWTPGEEPAELEVVMHRGGGVEGVVMDAARAEPVTRFRVQSFDRVEQTVEEPGRFNPFSGGVLFEDPAGRFALPALRAGEVTLTFRADGYLPLRLDEVQVAEGETTRGLIVKLFPGGAVSGSVLDPDGAPVAGAQVLALARGEGARRQRGGGPPLDLASVMPPALLGYAAGVGLLTEQATRSDATGAFELIGLAPGPTVLVALHPDYANGSSAEVQVVASETLADVVVRLSRGGGLYGTVEDRYGRPLPGSFVFAAAPARFVPGGRASDVGGGLYQALADASGEYRIQGMSGGSYFVVAARGDEGLDPLSFLQRFDFDLVTVPDDELVRFDLVDESAGGTRLYGYVSDRGEPVERGSLSAIGFGSDNLLGVDFKVARIRAGGAYEFEGLAPGEYQLQLEGAGARVRMSVEVPDAPEHRLDLALPVGSIEGEVVDAVTGEPVASCELLLRPLDEDAPAGLVAALIRTQGRVARERSDGEGRFRFERLGEGEYELSARPRRRGEGPSLGPAEPLELELGYDERLRGVRVELPAALVLAGTVRGAEGEPVAGASVRAMQSGALEPRAPRAGTDELGRFELGGLAAGTYALLVSADEYASRRFEGVVVEPGARELELVLERGVRVVLRLRGADGLPVEGARARLAPEGRSAPGADDLEGAFRQIFTGQGGTDEDGRLELGRHAPGTYELTVMRGLSTSVVPGVRVDGGADSVEVAVTLP